MEKYTNQTFYKLPESRQKELTKIARDNTYKRTFQDEHGVTFFVYDLGKNEEVAFGEDWHSEMITALYILLDTLSKTKNSQFIPYLVSTIKNNCVKEKVESLLKSLNKEELKEIYIECMADLRKQGVNFYQYISRQELHDALYQSKKTGEKQTLLQSALIDLVLELDLEVQQNGGIEQWIEEKKEKNRKGPKIYAKHKILLDKVWNESIEPNERKKCAKILIELQYSSDELATSISKGSIDVNKIRIMYEIPSLKRLVREAMGKINLSLAMLIFAVIEDRYILSKMNWNDIKIEELKVQGEKGMFSSVVAKFIVEMHKQGRRTLTQEEIDDIFAEEPDRKERMRAYFTLVQNGLYSDDNRN